MRFDDLDDAALLAALRTDPDGSARLLLYGFLGPQARSVTLKLPGGARPQTRAAGRGGAFIFALKLDDPAQGLRYDLRATYADGSTRVVDDGPSVESAPRLGPVPDPPPGYVDPLRDLAAPSRVRAPLQVTHRRLGKNTIYTIRFRAPVAIHRFGVEYSLAVDGPGEGKDCGDPLRFQGFNSQDDIRAGRRMIIRLTPAIAGRWNRGWCPGRYRATVILHDRRHPVGSFSFVAP